MTDNSSDTSSGSGSSFDAFSIDGMYQDGVTSRSVPCELQITEQGARLVGANVDIGISPNHLQLSDRIGSTPRRIVWAEPAVFVTNDNTGADRLQRLLPGGALGRVAFGLESKMPLAIAALLVVAVLMGSFLFVGIPAGSRYLAQKIPDSLGERAAEEVMLVLDQAHLEPSGLPAARQDDLRRYLRSFDSYPRKIHFRLAGEEIGANAFALPGGYVVITDELVELAENDDEVLAVYLHEVGHARGRHAETSVLQSSAWLVALTLITGDINGMTEAVFAVPVVLGQLAFSRDLEREADDFAIAGLMAHGLSPELLAAMLERMSMPLNVEPIEADAELERDSEGEETDAEVAALTQEEEQEDEQEEEQEEALEDADPTFVEKAGARLVDYLSTHPATTERLAHIRAAAQ